MHYFYLTQGPIQTLSPIALFTKLDRFRKLPFCFNTSKPFVSGSYVLGFFLRGTLI